MSRLSQRDKNRNRNVTVGVIVAGGVMLTALFWVVHSSEKHEVPKQAAPAHQAKIYRPAQQAQPAPQVQPTQYVPPATFAPPERVPQKQETRSQGTFSWPCKECGGKHSIPMSEWDGNTIQPCPTPPQPAVVSYHAKGPEHGFYTIVGKAVNPTYKTIAYAQVEFNLYNASGNLVGNTMANVTNWGPRQIWEFETMPFDGKGVVRYEMVDGFSFRK